MRKIIFASELPRPFKNFNTYLKFLGKRKAQVLLNTRKQIMERAKKDSMDIGGLYRMNNAYSSKIPFPTRNHTNCVSNSSMKRNRFQAKVK